MTRYTVFSDLHLNSGSFEWVGDLEFGQYVIMLGDNHEMKNVRKKHEVDYIIEYDKFLKKCEETKTNVLAGNHEIAVGKGMLNVYNIMIDDNLFTHGFIIWSESKIKRWLNKGFGSSLFKVWGIRIKNGSYKPSKHKSASISVRKKLSDYAIACKAKSITVGHMHYIWSGMHNGIRINIVGRGKTVIDI